MKRYLLAAVFEGLGIAVIVTMAVGGLTGMIVRDSLFTGKGGYVSATLGGVFVVSWVLASLVVNYALSHQRRSKC